MFTDVKFLNWPSAVRHPEPRFWSPPTQVLGLRTDDSQTVPVPSFETPSGCQVDQKQTVPMEVGLTSAHGETREQCQAHALAMSLAQGLQRWRGGGIE